LILILNLKKDDRALCRIEDSLHVLVLNQQEHSQYCMTLCIVIQNMKTSVSQKMKVLRYDWPSHFMFLLDILINPAKL